MDPTNLAKIERGEKNATVDTLVRFATGLGVDLSIQLAPSDPKPGPDDGPKRRSSAFHEAAHFVATNVVGWPEPHEVSIARFDRTDGHVGLIPPSDMLVDDPKDAIFFDLAVVAYAGALAERRLGLVTDKDIASGATSDEAAAEVFAYGRNVDLIKARRKSERVVEERWREIEALATQLLLRTSLPGAEATAIVLAARRRAKIRNASKGARR